MPEALSPAAQERVVAAVHDAHELVARVLSNLCTTTVSSGLAETTASKNRPVAAVESAVVRLAEPLPRRQEVQNQGFVAESAEMVVAEEVQPGSLLLAPSA